MKKYLRLSALGLTMVLMLSGCQGGGRGEMPHGMPAMQQQSTTTAVKTQLVELSTITNELMYSGSIEPSDEVNVSGSLSGKVANVNFDVGDKVNAGDILFTMDTESIEKSVKVSEASVNSAMTNVATAENNLSMANGATMQTQIENAKNAITSANNSVKNAQSSVTNAEVSLDNAKIQLDKANKDYTDNLQLFDVGGISQESIDNYKDTYLKAENAYTQAQLALEQANTQYSSAKDSLAQAQKSYDILVNQTQSENLTKAQDSLNSAKAQLESSKAQLENSKQSLKDAAVKAPVSGIVSQCNVTAGANLSQGSSPFVIINIDSVDVRVTVAQQLINYLSQGDEVRIAAMDSEFYGNISSISPDANSDGTYDVKINIPNADGKLKSGMFAEVYLTKEKSENAVVIPRDCIITKNDESYVFVIKDSIAKKCVVEIGIDNGNMVEITSGLSEGMTIVTEGQTYLLDGDEVRDVTNKTTEENNTKDNKQENMPPIGDNKGKEAKK